MFALVTGVQTCALPISVMHLIRGHPHVARRVVAAPMASICISAITKGELMFGLAKRPDAERLHGAVREFLRCADVLPWSDAVAERYGVVRAEMERRGQGLSPLDLLVSGHSLSADALL